MVSSENFFIIYRFFTILFKKFAGYVIISLEMPTFIQLFYCPNCKKNVSTDNAKKNAKDVELLPKEGLVCAIQGASFRTKCSQKTEWI